MWERNFSQSHYWSTLLSPFQEKLSKSKRLERDKKFETGLSGLYFDAKKDVAWTAKKIGDRTCKTDNQERIIKYFEL